MSRRLLNLVPILFICLLLPSCVENGSPYEESEFLRFVEEGSLKGHLDTAIATYKNKEGCRVDLIAAVHLADPNYYLYLRKRFENYEALLFELISDEGSVPRKGADDDESLVSLFQRTLCKAMNLSFQLDSIDYTQPNFVHADLTVKEFARLWHEKGESIWKIIIRVLSAQMKAQQKGMESQMTPAALTAALMSKDRAAQLKFLLAKEFQNIETLLAGLESGKEGEESVILGERNKACIRVLEEQMDEGKKRIAIFYGGGHMPDLELRLQRDLGFEFTKHQWITAWNIESTDE